MTPLTLSESTQLSDWPSLSRESSLGLEGSATKVVPRESVLQTKSLRPTTVTRPNAARPKVQFRHPSESSDATVVSIGLVNSYQLFPKSYQLIPINIMSSERSYVLRLV